MVNFIGRFFVLLMFSFSLLFLALSIGVYANHVDWKNPSKDNPGVVDQIEKKIGELAYARDRAVERYGFAYNTLGQVENERAVRQLYQSVKYNMLKTGKDDQGQVVATPVYPLEFDNATGLLQLRLIPADPNSAIQVRGQPLRSLEAYQMALAARHKDILDITARISSLQDQLAKQTDIMQGSPNVPGLIRQKEIMVEARQRTIDEQEYLKPTLANRFAEATLWLEREQDLRKYVQQLSTASEGDREPVTRAEGR